MRQSLSVKIVICQNQKSQISNRLLIKLFKPQKNFLSFIFMIAKVQNSMSIRLNHLLDYFGFQCHPDQSMSECPSNPE